MTSTDNPNPNRSPHTLLGKVDIYIYMILMFLNFDLCSRKLSYFRPHWHYLTFRPLSLEFDENFTPKMCELAHSLVCRR